MWSDSVDFSNRDTVVALVSGRTDPILPLQISAARQAMQLGHDDWIDSIASDLEMSEQARVCACYALAETRAISPSRVVPFLQSSNAWVQIVACESLGLLADPSAIEPLARLHSDKRCAYSMWISERVGTHAVAALLACGVPRTDPMVQDHVRAAYAALKGDESARHAAIKALVRIGDAEGAKLLASVADTTDDWEIDDLKVEVASGRFRLFAAR